jgi:hypothetical protein
LVSQKQEARMALNVGEMSSGEKIIETLKRSVNYMPDGLKEQWNALLSPENIAIMSATMLLFIVSHMFGVGEVVDAILLLVGAAMMGPAIVKAAEHFLAACDCTSANSEPELEKCADELAHGVILLGIDIALIVLLRRQAKSIELSRGGAGSSWIRTAKPGGRAPVMVGKTTYDPGGIGLPNVGPDPQPSAFWSKYSPVKDFSLQPGILGQTEWFGEIHYSGHLSPEVAKVTLAHEGWHSFLTPRIRPLRTVRVQLNAAGYGRSVFLRYLEEMMAEGKGQIGTFFEAVPFGGGTTIIRHILRFPLDNRYVTISQLQAEGMAIGTILIGSQVFTVTFVEGPFSSIFSRYPELVDLRKRSVVGIWTFEIPDWKAATENQRYANGWKGIMEFEGKALTGRCYWASRLGDKRHNGNWSVAPSQENIIDEILTFQFDDDDPGKTRTFKAVVGNTVCQGNYKNPGWPDGWFRLSR